MKEQTHRFCQVQPEKRVSWSLVSNKYTIKKNTHTHEPQWGINPAGLVYAGLCKEHEPDNDF